MSLHLSYVQMPLVFKQQVKHLCKWEASITPQFTRYYPQEFCQNNFRQKFCYFMMKNLRQMYPVPIFCLQIL
jgi:hypothetical protein